MEPIAIVGMGMRLPGGVRNETQYWDLLVNKRSGRCRVPKSRYNIDTWYGPGRAAHVGTEFGYFLDDLNLAHIDPTFWSMSKQEAASMDPRQRLLLEVVHEALENSGTTAWRGNDTGVYIGVMGDDWTQMKTEDGVGVDPPRADVFGDYIIANRISYEFDLKGPSIVVRTACSSSLTALHMAFQDLRTYVCDSAIVGGANLILSHVDTVAMTEQGVLSPSGECKTFDAAADGYGRGECVSAIYIKRLADALRCGDPIRAVIRATCVSGDGRTNGMTAPDPTSHERLIRKTYRLAGIGDISETAMVECHGTGTPIGDPLEVGAVASVWGEKGVYIGSVKPNIGHGEGGSGLSSIMKMVLALEKATLPPNINFKTPSPNIPWNETNIKVPLEPLPWPLDRQMRVSVNSFGIGGSNSHVIMESASLHGVQRPQQPLVSNKDGNPHLLIFSAKHVDSIKQSAKNIEQYIRQSPGSLRNVACTLATRRETYPYRAFAVTNHETPFNLSPIFKPANKPIPKIIWVFTGQGAQWAQMGKELIEHNRLVRQRIDELDAILASLPDPPSWTIRDEIMKPRENSRLYEAEYSQPCLTAIQVSLVDLLRSWGVEPDAVVGHSSGETAAAYASRAITAEEAIAISYHRGQITPLLKASHNGGMCAVGLGRSEIEPHLQPGVIIGCENSPSSVTLSGEATVLQSVMAGIRLHFPEALVRVLRVECGYHSAHMQTAAPEYESRLATLPKNRKAHVPFYSSVTGLPRTDLSPTYWIENLVSPVLFSSAVERLLQDFSSPIFLELGPHSALAGPIRQTLQELKLNGHYIPTIARNTDSISSTLSAAGQLWISGIDIKLNAINPNGDFLTDLPTYAWHYEKEYWEESRISRERRLRKFDQHELLGLRVLESSDQVPIWRCMLRLEDVSWLRDHVILNEVVFPATAYLAMAGEAIRQLRGVSSYTISEVAFAVPLTLTEECIELVTALSQQKSAGKHHRYSFSISSLCDDVWQEHVTGFCSSASDEAIGLSTPTLEQFPRKVSISSFYNVWRKQGLNYGPRFSCLKDVHSLVTGSQAIAKVQDMGSVEDASFYSIHPTTLDATLQLCMVASSQGLQRTFGGLEVPIFIEEMTVRAGQSPILVHSTTSQLPGNKKKSVIHGYHEKLRCISVEGLEVASLGRQASGDDDPHAAAILDWKPDVILLTLDDSATASQVGFHKILQLLGHKYPTMHVLEIGSGSAITRSAALEALYSEDSKRLYSTYTYLETSVALQPAAESVLRRFPAAKTVDVDLKVDPALHGFEKESFDLIILPMTVGGCKIDESIIRAAKTLVKLSGYLIFYYPVQSEVHRSLLSPTTDSQTKILDSLLIKSEGTSKQCRYKVINGHTVEGGLSYSITIPRVVNPQGNMKVSVICGDANHFLVSELLGFLKSDGFEIEEFILGQELRRGQTALCLLDLESPFLFNMKGTDFDKLKKTVHSLDDGGMLWLTGSSQLDCKDPNYSLTLGFTRTVRREFGVDLVTLELDAFTQPGWAATAKVLASFSARDFSSPPNPDSEYALSQGSVQICRFHRIKLSDELRNSYETMANRRTASATSYQLTDVADSTARHGPSPQGVVEIVTRVAAPGFGFPLGKIFKPDRTYLLIGGLGGIGMSCARFMVERGARHLLFFSRSASVFLEDNFEYREELEAMGCQVRTYSGHVNSMEDVRKALNNAIHPISGIIHAAMVLEDNNLTNMTADQWQSVVLPKVRGTWNVHHALNDQPERPDFFLLLSSLSGLGGQVGQANYAAANSFLDAFVQYRQNQGLACSVLDIGLVEDVGILARELHRLRAFESGATHKLREQDVLDAVELMICSDRCHPVEFTASGIRRSRKPAQLALGLKFDVSSAPVGINAVEWRMDPRVQSLWQDVSGDTETASNLDDTSLKHFLQECSSNPHLLRSDRAGPLLAKEVGKALVGLTMRAEDDINLDAPLESIGIDSLVSVELRNWIKKKTGVLFKVPEILSAKSITGIGELTVNKLQERYVLE